MQKVVWSRAVSYRMVLDYGKIGIHKKTSYKSSEKNAMVWPAIRILQVILSHSFHFFSYSFFRNSHIVSHPSRTPSEGYFDNSNSRLISWWAKTVSVNWVKVYNIKQRIRRHFLQLKSCLLDYKCRKVYVFDSIMCQKVYAFAINMCRKV